MKQFKQIIEIEKKYDRTISSAQSRAKIKLEKFEEELKTREENEKIQFKKEIESKSRQLINEAKDEVEKEIENAKSKANSIEKNASYDDTIEFTMNKLKEFGDN